MNLSEVQKRIDDWVSHYTDGYWPIHERLARLTEELGEVARAINVQYGHKALKPDEKPVDIAEELGDVILTAAFIANPIGINLEDAVAKALQKYATRDSERFENK